MDSTKTTKTKTKMKAQDLNRYLELNSIHVSTTGRVHKDENGNKHVEQWISFQSQEEELVFHHFKTLEVTDPNGKEVANFAILTHTFNLKTNEGKSDLQHILAVERMILDAAYQN